MSWARRELVVHDAGADRQFLASHDEALAARVKGEVTNKLTSGLNPSRHRVEPTEEGLPLNLWRCRMRC